MAGGGSQRARAHHLRALQPRGELGGVARPQSVSAAASLAVGATLAAPNAPAAWLTMSSYELDRQAKVSSSVRSDRLRLQVRDNVFMLTSFHPSRLNVNTGRLTKDMFDSVIAHARSLLSR